jgi:hypothetical protein
LALIGGLLGGGSITAACAPVPTGPQTEAEEVVYALVGLLVWAIISPALSDAFSHMCFCPVLVVEPPVPTAP